MWEVITGSLAAGAAFGDDVGLPRQLERPIGVSLYLTAIEPTLSMPFDTFTSRGRRTDDVPIPENLARCLAAVAAEVGVSW